ncbi:hypothetical protein M2145_002536 [Lachnospiraceae bacterium PF1-21]
MMERKLDQENVKAYLDANSSLFAGLDIKTEVALKNEIKLGFWHGLGLDEISLYAKKGFDDRQMQTVRIALEEGIDREYVESKIANLSKTSEQMVKAKVQYYLNNCNGDKKVDEIYVAQLKKSMSEVLERLNREHKFLESVVLELEEKGKLALTKEEENRNLRIVIKEKEDEIASFRNLEKDLRQELADISMCFDTFKKEQRTSRSSEKVKQRFKIPFLSKRISAKPDWLIQLISDNDFTIQHVKLLYEAYRYGVDKDSILQISSKPLMTVEKMQSILLILYPDFDLAITGICLDKQNHNEEEPIDSDDVQANQVEDADVMNGISFDATDADDMGEDYEDPYEGFLDDEGGA